MFLIVGLGNPGDKYSSTRHNIGFQLVDLLAERLGVVFSSTKWDALAVKSSFSDEQILLLKPLTYMNLSGKAVLSASSYYKIATDKIVIVHDDLDLPFGAIKVVVSRGAGGHNGIRSIISLLGNKDFVRIKVGIGRPTGPMPVEHYVLGKMSNEEKECVEHIKDIFFEAVEIIVSQGVPAAMNKINSKKNRLK